MPVRRRYQRRSRKSYRRRSRPLIQKNSSKQQIGFYKLRGVYTVTSDGAGNINNGFRITEPDNFDGSSTPLTDWTGISSLYDEFRVCAIRMQWIPDVPNDTTATTLYRPLYVYTDFDQVGLSLTDSAAIGYGNMQVKNMCMPWSYYIKIPKMAAYGTSYNAQAGYMDTANPPPTGAIYLSKATGLSNSKVYGTVVLTYYIQALERK